MGVKYFHRVALKLFGDFAVGAIFESLLSCNIDQQSLILQHCQFILKDGYFLDQFLTFHPQFLIHGYVLHNHISKVVPPRVELPVAAEDVLLGQLLEGYEARVCGDDQLLRFWPEFTAP